MFANSPISPVLRAADLARAKRFYTETLGLPLLMEIDDAVFSVSAGQGTRLNVYLRDGSTAPVNTVAAWIVDDLDAAVRDLAKRGISLERYPGIDQDAQGIASFGPNRIAWFTDTEGNIFQVSQA